jgi:Fe-S-cluster containining protein
MENFFNYISKPVHPDDVQVWLNINNIIPEKVELYSDFTSSLYKLILNTYLGEDDNSNESNIRLTEEDNTCQIYDHRPKACKEYPHTNRKNMMGILQLTAKNVLICPAVGQIMEKLEQVYLSPK